MHYLAAMQKVYNQEGFDTLPSQANTNLFNYGLQGLFLLLNNSPTVAYGMDIPLYGAPDHMKVVQEHLDSTTLYEAFLPEMMEEDHEIFVPGLS